MDQTYDILVIGAGPGGYAAAIRAAQLGLSSALVEREDLGGVCLNRGCIPSKAMLRSAEVLGWLGHAGELGVAIDGVMPDYAAAVARRDRVVAGLRQGLVNLLRGNGVEVIRGAGRLLDAHTCSVESSDGARRVGFRNLVVATGSSAVPLRVPGAELGGVIDSDGALALADPPARVVVIGGGAVGVEWADVWQAFGSEVTILEMLPRLVPTEDADISRELARAFDRRGIACHPSAEVRAIRNAASLPLGARSGVTGRDAALEVLAVVEGQERRFPADAVLTAVGRRANVAGLGLDVLGVETDRRGIVTDGFMRTSVPHIFAVGDVTGRSLLAHAATHQAMIAVGTIVGQNPHPFDAAAVPAAIFTTPEIASIGTREAEARELGIAIVVARFPFAASGRAAAAGDTGGFVKLVAREDDHRVLGVHIVGGPAADLIGEAALGIRLGATLEDLADTVHVHPTFSEALLEAAWAGLGTPLHVPPPRRSLRESDANRRAL